jgi:hypothetical protein
MTTSAMARDRSSEGARAGIIIAFTEGALRKTITGSVTGYRTPSTSLFIDFDQALAIAKSSATLAVYSALYS